MQNKLRSINWKIWLPIILIAFVTFISYGKTLQMYYWEDDYSVALKMINPPSSPGNFGAGVFGEGAYRYNLTPNVFLYPIFKFNTVAYFAIGLIIYFAGGIVTYFLTRRISKNNLLSTAAGVIFASGYIGSYAIYHLNNSYQLTGTAIFMALTSWFLISYYKTNKTSYYWKGLVMFFLTLELFLLRSHGIILIVLFIPFLFSKNKITTKNLKALLLKLLPFVSFYYFMYFVDPRILVGGESAKHSFGSTFSLLLKEKQFFLFNNFLGTVTNILIPNPILDTTYQYLKKLQLVQSLAPLPFIVTLVISLKTYLKDKNKKRTILTVILLVGFYIFHSWSFGLKTSSWNPSLLESYVSSIGGNIIILLITQGIFTSKTVLFGFIWIISTLLAYFIYSPNASLISSARYAVPTMVGVGIFYASLFWRLCTKLKRTRKGLFILFVFVLSSSLIVFVRRDETRIIKQVSVPARQGYSLIKESVNNINKNSVFLIDSVDDPVVRNNILGGMPQRGISVFSGQVEDVKVAVSFEELYHFINSKAVKLEDVHTFFASRSGLVDTSAKFKELLTSQNKRMMIPEWNNLSLSTQMDIQEDPNKGTVGNNPIFISDVDIDGESFLEITINMVASPILSTNTIYPYSEVSQKAVVSKEEMVNSLKSYSERKAFLRSVSAEATSEWKTTEVEYLIDGKNSTDWSAHNTSWNASVRPQDVVLDLGLNKNVRKLYWVNNYTFDTPTAYDIFLSNDKINWTKVKSVIDGSMKKNGETVVEDLNELRNARYVKFSIFETFRGSGHPPSIDEIWVSQYSHSLDVDVYESAISCPLCYIEDYQQASTIYSLIGGVSRIRLSWLNDKVDSFKPKYSEFFDIMVDGRPHTYTIHVPAGGTKIKSLRLDRFSLPGRYTITNATYKHLNLQEVSQRNLIPYFAKEDIRNLE